MAKSRFIVGALLGILLAVVIVVPVYADTCRIQMPASGYDPLGGQNVTNSWVRLGQRLTIPNREILSIGYHVRRVGSPTGDVTLSIYDVETDVVLFSQVWGDASSLPESGASGYCEVTLDPPIRINREARLCVEYYGGNATDYCRGAYYTGDKITGESYTNYYHYGQWHDIGEAEEGSYCYTYTCQADPSPDGDGVTEPPNIRVAIIAGAVVCVAGIAYLMHDKRRNT